MELTDISGYRVVRKLGSGGMGDVYLVDHPRLPRRDAIKVLSRSLSMDPQFTARFQREAEVLAGIAHPNVVTAYDRGAIDDRLWLAMEYIDGADASQVLKRDGPLHPDVVGDIIGGVGAALDAVWQQRGLTHRDVKPANVLLALGDPGSTRPSAVKLVDFGIAKAADEASSLTATGAAMGTMTYMSPEAIESRRLDSRSDLYSLACTAFELLTGGPPYPDNGIRAMMMAHLGAPIPDVTLHRPGLPAALNPVFHRALAKEPGDRYATGAQFAAAYRAALATAPPARTLPAPALTRQAPAGAQPGTHDRNTRVQNAGGPAPASAPPAAARSTASRRGLLLAIGALVAVLVLAALGYSWLTSDTDGGAPVAAPSSIAAPTSAAPSPSAPSQPTVTGTDAAGFVGEYARCGDGETLRAAMITEASSGSGRPAHVVICDGASGPVYRAAQVGDTVGISLQATPVPGGYTAFNPNPGGSGGTSYRAVLDSGVTVTSPDGASEFLRWSQIWQR
ncbi:serine/threonine-protein kinase [Tsukamurella sp. 1534]|uniref:serine/threonine-protein kinase n=1 Tax=Tsukamurella sp. 1534 TaxID=1151061 RepID=UPI000318ABC4|nr:serine/threonine-protein kinase [Tsukamurella sp. 1534]